MSTIRRDDDGSSTYILDSFTREAHLRLTGHRMQSQVMHEANACRKGSVSFILGYFVTKMHRIRNVAFQVFIESQKHKFRLVSSQLE